MDILNASRKTEMVKEIRPWYGKAGAALVITGLFLAMAVPGMTVRMFKQGLPGIWNATYLLALLGLYMVIFYSKTDNQKYVCDRAVGVCNGDISLLGCDVLFQRYRRRK